MTDKEWTTEKLEDMKWVNNARPLTRIEVHEIIECAQKQAERVHLLGKQVASERAHKLTYRKVAKRYQDEKNRYREALEGER